MLSEAKSLALRFFRNIPLFRRDGVADPQIPDRSGDEFLDVAIGTILTFRASSEAFASSSKPETNEAFYDQGRLSAFDGAIGVLRTIKANQENRNAASVKDTDSDIA